MAEWYTFTRHSINPLRVASLHHQMFKLLALASLGLYFLVADFVIFITSGDHRRPRMYRLASLAR